MRGVAEALLALDAPGALNIRVILHPNPTLAAAMRGWLGSARGIELVAPLDHQAMLNALRNSDIVLSDSGGVQEECPALGVPLLVLRERTERPEGIVNGNMLLVGTDRDRIVATVLQCLNPAVHATMARPSFPFGDGKAGPRIANLVATFLDARSARARYA